MPSKFPIFQFSTDLEDYYKILGLERQASVGEIRRAYLSLARGFHPDMVPHDEKAATLRFQEISEAYSVLADPGRRERYDRAWANFKIHGEMPKYAAITTPVKRWEGPGAKYRKARGGRKRYFNKPGGLFGF